MYYYFTYLVTLFTLVFFAGCSDSSPINSPRYPTEKFTVYSIGKVTRQDNRTFIVLDKKYQPGLRGLDQFSNVTVIYWFDRNDTPEKRAILEVHPRGDIRNPKRGVFATHSPVRPNLIAISQCKIISIKDNVIEIDAIDAFDNSPVLDLKN